MTSINALEIPVSTVQSATAASYTIPANRYAIVRASVHRGGTLSINGVVVMTSSDLTWNTLSSNVSPVVINNNSGGARPAGFAVYTDGQNSPVSAGDAFTNATARAFSSQQATTFKVPTGATIVGTGDARYHIELYREPGAAS